MTDYLSWSVDNHACLAVSPPKAGFTWPGGDCCVRPDQACTLLVRIGTYLPTAQACHGYPGTRLRT